MGGTLARRRTDGAAARLGTARHDDPRRATLASISLARGAWEIRVVEIESIEPGAPVAALRVGGWAIAGDDPVGIADGSGASATVNGTSSTIQVLGGDAVATIERRRDSSPLGVESVVPVLTGSAVEGTRLVALVGLHGNHTLRRHPAGDRHAAVELRDDDDSLTIDATWPDGLRTSTRLTRPRTAIAAARHPDRAQ